jgi:hypothetical protein
MNKPVFLVLVVLLSLPSILTLNHPQLQLASQKIVQSMTTLFPDLLVTGEGGLLVTGEGDDLLVTEDGPVSPVWQEGAADPRLGAPLEDLLVTEDGPVNPVWQEGGADPPSDQPPENQSPPGAPFNLQQMAGAASKFWDLLKQAKACKCKPKFDWLAMLAKLLPQFLGKMSKVPPTTPAEAAMKGEIEKQNAEEETSNKGLEAKYATFFFFFLFINFY